MSSEAASPSSVFAKPKSRIFTVSSLATFTLAGLRSRWMIARSRAYSSTSQIRLAMFGTCPGQLDCITMSARSTRVGFS
jgi:hypothetical protein